MKLSKNKKRILKTRRVKKMVTFKGILVRTSNDFSAETLQARREQNDISRIIERKKCQPRILFQQSYHSDTSEK